MAYFLRLGDDDLEDAEKHTTKADAIDAFRTVADELDRFGQSITASLHIADTWDEVVEYPDFVLERGPRGGVKVERA
ncbi:hypothetical protein SAMN05216466_10694 [Paraburkholderia phenazinium]|uniref:Uncharacterized protein n=1 Tax=Paraburkholderia phenazinium TaxID=60549 RepID=A0A1G7Y9U6_9BURK|nr:hypothetical protein [Paraburkholderia phenazinium]SDG93103.1 hypothetical protein SAMN05216466_10694 [Paraburkholderia phenazinium]